MSVPYEKIVAEDLNLGTGTVEVTMPAGGTATGHAINPATFAALAFAADAVGTQSLAASILSTIEMSDEDFDVQGWFNPATYAFIPLKAGYYLLTGSVAIASFTGTLTVGIYKNGVLVDSVTIQGVAAIGKAQVTTVVAANGSTDTFVIKAFQTDAAAKAVTTARFSGAGIGGL